MVSLENIEIRPNYGSFMFYAQWRLKLQLCEPGFLMDLQTDRLPCYLYLIDLLNFPRGYGPQKTQEVYYYTQYINIVLQRQAVYFAQIDRLVYLCHLHFSRWRLTWGNYCNLVDQGTNHTILLPRLSQGTNIKPGYLNKYNF